MAAEHLLPTLALLVTSPWSRLHAAQEPEAPRELAFARRTWTSNDGLPQNSATAIVQARDGFLWVGTYGGLCRFDGERMEVFDAVTAPELRGNRVVALHESADGTLWIGSDQSGLASLRAGRFRAHPELARDPIQCLGSDREGRLLVGTTREFFLRDGEDFRALHTETLLGVSRLAQRRSGAILLVATDGLYELEGDEVRRLWSGRALCVTEYEGEVLLGTETGLHALVGGTLEPRAPFPSLRTIVHALLVARDGTLWVGTELGPVYVRSGELAELPLAARLQESPRDARAARTLCEDREGGVWVGHSEVGLMRLRNAEVRGHRVESGLPPRGIVSVLGDGRGGLFVGTSRGLMRGQRGRFEAVPGAAELGSCRGMALDPDGTLWFATRQGLARLDASGLELWLGAETDWPAMGTRAILRAPDGTHWLAGSGGLARLSGREVRVPPEVAELGGENLRSLAMAPDGALWIGGSHVLARLDEERGTLRLWRTGRELPFGEVRAILPEVGERAWFASYGGGLVLVDGARVVAIDKRQGLLDPSLGAVLPLDAHLALSSNSGIFLLARSELEDVAAGRRASVACRPLRTDGARPAECDGGLQPCATEADGRLYFCGIDALHELDPSRIEPLAQDLPVRLEHLYLGDQLWRGSGSVELPRGQRALELRLAACSFDYPSETRFRWRLGDEHTAGDWSAPTREADVRLTDLPRGTLRFEAEAVDLEGRSSRVPLRLELEVPARLHETTLFRIGAALALIAAASFLMRFGARRSARRAAELERLVGERTSELLAARADLERRVEERTLELRSEMHRREEEQSQRQRVEQELRRLQSMESLGLLAGGIAHDFNNILTVAWGASELLAREAGSARATELCQSIHEACQRGRSLTQHLLAVASRQPVMTERLDLNAVITALLPVLRSLLGESIALRFEPALGTPTVRAAVTQIEQLLLNLASNARDALPEGGTFTLQLCSEAERVVLTVADDGEGMPPELLERAFEPFFSTREGPGRGLGLATVYGIVRQLGGEVRLASEPGRGTRVHLALPRAQPARADEDDRSILRPEPRRQPMTVLLVEDEPEVRRVVRLLLESLGCRVLEAESGPHALELLRRNPGQIDLALSDVVMPGLHGRRLVEALREVQHELPIVLMSGYLDGRLSHQDLAEMGLEILAKPLERARLAESLERARHATPEPSSG